MSNKRPKRETAEELQRQREMFVEFVFYQDYPESLRKFFEDDFCICQRWGLVFLGHTEFRPESFRLMMDWLRVEYGPGIEIEAQPRKEVIARIEAATKVRETAGQYFQAAKTTRAEDVPLSESEERVYKVIKAQPAGILGRHIVDMLAKDGFPIEQGTLTSHIIPKLKKLRNVQNRPNVGYFIPPT